MEEKHILADIRDFIQGHILAAGQALLEDTDLKEAGIDSFSMVEIILFMERQFAISIPDEELVPEHFRNLQSLTRLVSRLSSNRPVA
jgi:acyl carrier protein